MNAYQVNFESVYGIKDSVVAMFKTLENTGLRSFLSFPVIINEHSLLDFYANSIVTINKKISYSFDGQTFLRWSSVRFHFLSTYRRDFRFFSNFFVSYLSNDVEILYLYILKKERDEYGIPSTDGPRFKGFASEGWFFRCQHKKKVFGDGFYHSWC